MYEAVAIAYLIEGVGAIFIFAGHEKRLQGTKTTQDKTEKQDRQYETGRKKV